MSQNLTLRQAAKKIYEENSLRVSTCYGLENLQEINVIFIPGDAPAYVKEVAAQLERHVRLKYPDCCPVTLSIPEMSVSSVKSGHYDEIYAGMEKELRRFDSFSSRLGKAEAVVLADARTIVEMLLLYGNKKQDSGEDFVPRYFLDVNAYMRNDENPGGGISRYADIAPEALQSYMPYLLKRIAPAECLIAYAGGYESWIDLVYAWHEIKRRHGILPRIIYVDDLCRWTSMEYSDKIFRKFEKFLSRLKVKMPVQKLHSSLPQLIINSLNDCSGIAFLPQNMTYHCGRFQKRECWQGQLSFNISERDFDSVWENSGPIARQFFCQELAEFISDWTNRDYNEKGYDFYRLFRHRRFKNWNLRFYWWNYKIRLGNVCRQIYLSEYSTFR